MGKKHRDRNPQDEPFPFRIDPITTHWTYQINYRHSYAQDSAFFDGLTKGKLLGSACTACPKKYATPRGHCMACGAKTQWAPLPSAGKIHTFTRCYYGGESFQKELPYTLIMVEFEGFDTLFLSRLKEAESVRIGMAVKAKFIKDGNVSARDVYFIPTKND